MPRPAASKPADPDACRTPESVDDQLDAELEQSFPASDPPSVVRSAPVDATCSTQKKKEKGTTPMPQDKGQDRRP